LESTIQSGKIRLRPVVLTAITTILGLIPLTTGFDFDWQAFHFVTGGANTAFWQPMGTAIIFGLTFATFLTLIIIPVLFVSVNNFLDRVFKRNKKKELNLIGSIEEPIKPVTT
jgi:multidrug efflux pump subunit AcrB